MRVEFHFGRVSFEYVSHVDLNLFFFQFVSCSCKIYKYIYKYNSDHLIPIDGADMCLSSGDEDDDDDDDDSNDEIGT